MSSTGSRVGDRGDVGQGVHGSGHPILQLGANWMAGIPHVTTSDVMDVAMHALVPDALHDTSSIMSCSLPRPTNIAVANTSAATSASAAAAAAATAATATASTAIAPAAGGGEGGAEGDAVRCVSRCRVCIGS